MDEQLATRIREALESGDYRAALLLLEEEASREDPEALYELGVMYRRGEGVEANSAEAARLWGLAADRGHPDSTYNLGTLYWLGEGVEKDASTAVRLTETAAKQGLPEAAYKLAMLLSEDPARMGEASEWIFKAANGGWPPAQVHVAIAHFVLGKSNRDSGQIEQSAHILSRVGLAHPVPRVVLREAMTSQVPMGKNPVIDAFLFGVGARLGVMGADDGFRESTEALDIADIDRVLAAIAECQL